MTTTMPSLLDQARERHAHPGLLLEYGLLDCCGNQWRYGDSNNDKAKAVKQLVGPDYQPNLSLYKVAFNRWKREMQNSEARRTCCWWRGQVMQRLFLGLGERATYTLETAVTLDPTYGLPMIPGSTLKGIARAVARSRLPELSEREAEDLNFLIATLFGRPGKDEGCLRFLPAWWDPDSATSSLVQEVITPHHDDYYAGKEPYPTGRDSPIPAPQLAVQGAFWFAIEGVSPWREHGAALLKIGLSDPKFGVGAASHAGYGLFDFSNDRS